MDDELSRRKHRRIKTKLLGRYLLADGREAKCTVVDVSLGGIALRAAERGKLGEPVIVYVDQIGRLQGSIVRYLDEGFAIALTVTTRAAEKFAIRLAELEANHALVRDPERRQEPRMRMDDEPPVGGANAPAFEVLDLSLTGANLKMAEPRPGVGSFVRLGKLRGKVVRHSRTGIGIEFLDAEAVTLTDRMAEVGLR